MKYEWCHKTCKTCFSCISNFLEIRVFDECEFPKCNLVFWVILCYVLSAPMGFGIFFCIYEHIQKQFCCTCSKISNNFKLSGNLG